MSNIAIFNRSTGNQTAKIRNPPFIPRVGDELILAEDKAHYLHVRIEAVSLEAWCPSQSPGHATRLGNASPINTPIPLVLPAASGRPFGEIRRACMDTVPPPTRTPRRTRRHLTRSPSGMYHDAMMSP